MKLILEEIKRALDARLFYLAVSTAIALPDICAALEQPDGRTTSHLYKKFYDTWLRAPNYLNLPSDDMYLLRCGIIHQGIAGHEDMRPTRVIFTVPNPPEIAAPFAAHNFTIAGRNIPPHFCLDAVRFCEGMIIGISKWYEAKKDDPFVASNISNLVQYRPNGLPPYIAGFPVIA